MWRLSEKAGKDVKKSIRHHHNVHQEEELTVVRPPLSFSLHLPGCFLRATRARHPAPKTWQLYLILPIMVCYARSITERRPGCGNVSRPRVFCAARSPESGAPTASE